MGRSGEEAEKRERAARLQSAEGARWSSTVSVAVCVLSSATMVTVATDLPTGSDEQAAQATVDVAPAGGERLSVTEVASLGRLALSADEATRVSAAAPEEPGEAERGPTATGTE